MSTSNPIHATRGQVHSSITVMSGKDEIAIIISGRYYKGTNTFDDPDEIYDITAETVDGNPVLLTDAEESFAEAELLSTVRNR